MRSVIFGFFNVSSHRVRVANSVLDGFGLFVVPFQEEFNWSQTEIYAGFSIGATTSCFVGFVIGFLVDRFKDSSRWVHWSVIKGVRAVMLFLVLFIYGLLKVSPRKRQV